MSKPRQYQDPMTRHAILRQIELAEQEPTMTDTRTETSDLVKRLRYRADGYVYVDLSMVNLLRDAADALEEAERVIANLLASEKEMAKVRGFADCCCINFSRERERQYETGTCPHQLAADYLARHATGQRKGGDDDSVS